MTGMKKTLLTAGLSLVIAGSVMAQSISHKIIKGETLSAIALKYGTTVGDIMRLNGMNASSKLAIGQIVKIPSAAKKTNDAVAINHENQVNANTKEHIVQKSETLYGISKKYNVTISQIKQWNNLSNENIQIGQKLIVSNSSNINTVQTASPKEELPTKQVEANNNKNQVEDNTEVNNATEQKSIKATSIEVVPATTITTDPNKSSTEKIAPSDIPVEGFFKNDFLRESAVTEIKTIDGTGMVFKSTSGWDDRKYYILMNDAPVGSIVKVTANNKTIYAKVLWKLEEMKLNEGLKFRLSDAAANALGIADNKFNLIIEYK